jgi:hypothetical protein
MRHTFVVLLAAALASGCAGQPEISTRSAVDSPCRATDLPACENGLAESLRGATPDTWTKPYVEARAVALGPQDPWVALHSTLQHRGSGAFVVLAAPGQGDVTRDALRAETSRVGDEAAKVVVVESPALPKPENLSEAELLFALARLAGAEQVLWNRDGKLVRVLGNDLLAPIVFRLPAILEEPIQGDATAAMARAIRIDHLVNEGLRHLARGSYAEAATLAVQLETMIAKEPPDGAATLRARFLVSRARSFGTEFPKRDARESQENEPAWWNHGSAEQGAYAAWLRVSLAGNDSVAAWTKHRATVAAACSPDRMALLDLLHGFDPATNARQCDVERRALPEDALRGDPLFAIRLALQAQQGTITPADWSRAYDALVAETEATGTSWYVLPSLLFERGELPGMSARGSRTYGRVTRLAVDHLRALERFQKTAPDKYSPTGQLTIALQPGALSDPDIVSVLHPLVADNVKYKLAPATTAGELLETSVVLGFMGAMLPDPIRGAYLVSLRKGLEDKLRSGFAREAGWGTAALYALNVAGAYVLGETPDLAFAGDGITRALEASNDIQVRPIALVAARGVHYGTLAATGELEPEKVGSAKFGAKRQAARERLETALRAMADAPEPVPAAPLGQLTTLIDGLIATSALVIEKSPKGQPADACARDNTARSLPEVQKNLRTIATSRDALLRDPAIRAGKTTWARRAGLLVVIASDTLDLLAAPAGSPPTVTVPPERARSMVASALGEWTKPDVAAGAASLHALARAVVTEEGDWQAAVDARRDDMAKVLMGSADLLGTGRGSSLARVVVSEGARFLSDPGTHSVSESAPKLVDIARALLDANQKDHGTVALLMAGALGGDATTLRNAAQLATTHKNASAWYLTAQGAVRGADGSTPLDATAYERGLRAVTDDACKVAQVEPLVEVAHAVQSFAQGGGKTAADKLDQVLARAEERGLSVPRAQYQLDEILEGGRTLRMNMHMTTGQGFISENSFSIGFDVFSTKPTSGLRVEIPAAVDEDAGRYYAHVASLGAIYHLLEGRDGPAARDAERMLNATLLGVRLGSVNVVPTDQGRWVSDLDPNLYVAAELASQRGHVLLAGGLWSLALGSQEKRPVGKAFTPPKLAQDAAETPVGLRSLRGVRDLEGPIHQSRALVEQAATCDPKQRPASPTNLDTCQAFRRAIAMWHAGVFEKPPTMRAGAQESCTREAALLGILQELSSTGPLPPRIQDAVAEFISTTAKRGYSFDALVLLRSMRDRGACVPKLVSEARAIGRGEHVTPHARVDWIGYALTCPGRQPDDTVWEDLRLLADSSRKIGDVQVPYRVHTAVVRYMVNQQAWARLAEFSRDPGFVQLMNQGGPSGAAMALLVRHTADTLAGAKPDIAGTLDTYDIACVRFGNAGREQVCRELGTFRNRVVREPGVDLGPGAEQLLKQVVGL